MVPAWILLRHTLRRVQRYSLGAAAAVSLLTGSIFAQGASVEDARPVPAFDAAKRVSGPNLGFLVLGDWGVGGKAQRRIADAMASTLLKDGAVAVITTGDNFYPSGVAGTDDPQWQSKFERMYTRDAFPVPFLPTLGNHDHDGNPDAQVSYTGLRLPDGTITRWRMTGRTWVERFSTPDNSVTVRVIGLDTQDIVTARAEARDRQVAWLDSVLGASNETWTIVTGHHPVYSNGRHGNTLGMIRFVKPLLEKHRIPLYLAGHDHDIQVLKPVEGVQYVISGGGGGARSVRWASNTLYAGTNQGYVWLQAGKDELLIHALDAAGTIRYAHVIPRTR